MSKKTSYFLGIILTIIIGTILYIYLCCSVCCGKDRCENKKTETESAVMPGIKEATKNTFYISDADSDFNIKFNENFNFTTSDFAILEPVSENVENGVSKLKTYLLDNPSKTVEITGFYKSDEANNSAYPNLGLARANAVKNYLILHDVSSKQIDTYGALNDAMTPDGSDTLFGPVKFGIQTIYASNTADIEAACDALRANPLVLHFQTGQASINLTAEQRQKIADMSHCVDKLGVKLQVVGHTDNTGNSVNNVVLGKKRADFAKGYLVKNGILENTIVTSSKGQHVPIADNATEAGRAENRRTEITIN